MQYFKFSSVELQEKKIINRGEFIYYTGATPDQEEMKSIVKQQFDSHNNEIALFNICEINKDEFLLLAKHIEGFNLVLHNS